MNLEESFNKLFSLHQFGIKLGLENIQRLLQFIGNPEVSLQTIHIAGSNGKGSTASFISSILMEAGYKTGLYTSPHLVKFNERIRINGIMITDDFVLDFMNDLNGYIDEHSPTFFELTTAMAFKYFAESNVDYAVIETGLGGRLDATNVLNPLASVITTISEEHTNILGYDLKKIAFEKGEIIKKNSNTILGIIEDEPRKVLINKTVSVDSKCFLLSDHINPQKDPVELKYNNEQIIISDLPLKGRYQINNAALAVLAVKASVPEVNKKQILAGLKNVINNSGIQARYEIFNKEPQIIFDAAHNLDGIEEFLNEFKKKAKSYSKNTVIYGTMKDKNYSSILTRLSQNFDNIYITEIIYERAASVEEVVKAADSAGLKVYPLYEPVEYINEFISKNKNECLVILGSIYVLGEIKKKLLINLT
ncbi:Dihydrofolate synthase @ Folylpolyglutamate synthase [hydrothermal vent metagenome]|uniref:tetrahydrofolate synthase n=1 Tax=hydrothermal vent metagenome TaxID=652676 RepID=A0A3B1C9U6_9ZZZZ